MRFYHLIRLTEESIISLGWISDSPNASARKFFIINDHKKQWKYIKYKKEVRNPEKKSLESHTLRWQNLKQRCLKQKKSYPLVELCVCPWCLPSAGHMSQRLPWEVRAVVADGHLWCQHPTGIKDAALPNVTNVWLHTQVLIWSDSQTQRLFKGRRMICAPESLHSVHTGLKPWNVMPLDNIRMWAVYLKKKKKWMQGA